MSQNRAAGLAVVILVMWLTSCGSGSANNAAASSVDERATTSVTSSAVTTESRANSTTSATLSTSVTTATPFTTATTTNGPTSADSPTSSTTVAPETVAPSTAPQPSATLPAIDVVPEFSASISEIDDATAARLTHSWREGCPVPLEALRLVSVTHWNYAGSATTGELIVHADVAADIVTVFDTLYGARFPIERMELVDAYGGDDDRSMAANNTSAFNCREVAWKPGVWSNHALGTAIDVNPLVNPYVSTSRVLPPEGAAFADRSIETLGGLYPGDVATAAFTDIGWGWGGTWSTAKDWQHFSVSGR